MQVKDIHCDCKEFLCQRKGDEFIYHSFQILVPRSPKIRCPNCGKLKHIAVDRKKVVDNRQKSAKIER